MAHQIMEPLFLPPMRSLGFSNSRTFRPPPSLRPESCGHRGAGHMTSSCRGRLISGGLVDIKQGRGFTISGLIPRFFCQEIRTSDVMR